MEIIWGSLLDKEKYSFQAGTELMGIWSLAVNGENEKEMVSKLDALIQNLFVENQNQTKHLFL